MRGGDGDLVAELTRWMAERRVDAAASARARERWLGQRAAEQASFAGILIDLAERAQAIVFQCAGSRRHRGSIGAVAEDFCALRGEHGADALLRYAGMVSVTAVGPSPTLTGDRSELLDMTFAEAVGVLAEDRPRVLVVTLGGDRLAGDLALVGLDVLTLHPEGKGQPTYVPLATIAEVSLAR